MRPLALSVFALTAAFACACGLDATGLLPAPGDSGATPDPSDATFADAPSDAGGGDATPDGGEPDAPLPCDAAALSDDPANCGACGRSCQGGACVTGVCGPTELIAGEDQPLDLRIVGGSSIYWVNAGKITNTGTIRRAKLDGTGAVTLASGLPSPEGIEVTASNIYWTNYDDSTYWKSDLAGGNRSLIYGGVVGCLSYDGASQKMYGIDYKGGRVLRLDPGNPTVLKTGQSNPWGVFVYGTTLYWTTGTDIIIAALDGSSATSWQAGEGAPECMTTDGNDLYWADWGSGTVNRRSLTNSGVVRLVDKQSKPAGIALFNGVLYWTAGSSLMKLVL